MGGMLRKKGQGVGRGRGGGGVKHLEQDGNRALDRCNMGHHMRYGATYLHIMTPVSLGV